MQMPEVEVGQWDYGKANIEQISMDLAEFIGGSGSGSRRRAGRTTCGAECPFLALGAAVEGTYLWPLAGSR